jgi:hypothetical protein
MKLNADFDYVYLAPRLVWRGLDGIQVERDEAPGASAQPSVGRVEVAKELPPQMRSPEARKAADDAIDEILGLPVPPVPSKGLIAQLKARKSRGH